MAKTPQEYVEWLDGKDLIWPVPPKAEPIRATPYLKPLDGIRAVTWSVYGTLLRITDGELLLQHPQKIRMQVALEKTINEFNMWNSMTRKPGAPWESMLRQYNRMLDDEQMASSGRKGDVPQPNSATIWRKLVAQLEQKGYAYDEGLYGDAEEYSEKIAYFFQASLQGVEAAANARTAMLAVAHSNLQQGLLADAQPFTLVQLLRALNQQGTLPPLVALFVPSCLTLSYLEGVRKPSLSLYETCLARFEKLEIGPEQVLHVGSRLQGDLAIAKQLGMCTALYAGEKSSLQASSADMKNPKLKPDRLLTDLAQIRDILAIG